MWGVRRVLSAGLMVSALASGVAAVAQTPSGMPSAAAPAAAPSAPAAVAPEKAELPRFLVYFNEFSAYLSPRSKGIIEKAAKEAKTAGATSITVQARASATGTVQTNKYLAMTRASIVADELQADGVDPAMIHQEPIGQTGSSDPSVFNRRVDIVLHR
jgi:outer membrane protein OmpA-like peptidoglycan-associated protein